MMIVNFHGNKHGLAAFGLKLAVEQIFKNLVSMQRFCLFSNQGSFNANRFFFPSFLIFRSCCTSKRPKTHFFAVLLNYLVFIPPPKECLVLANNSLSEMI